MPRRPWSHPAQSFFSVVNHATFWTRWFLLYKGKHKGSQFWEPIDLINCFWFWFYEKKKHKLDNNLPHNQIIKIKDQENIHFLKLLVQTWSLQIKSLAYKSWSRSKPYSDQVSKCITNHKNWEVNVRVLCKSYSNSCYLESAQRSKKIGHSCFTNIMKQLR